jgi:hypothetical protein
MSLSILDGCECRQEFASAHPFQNAAVNADPKCLGDIRLVDGRSEDDHLSGCGHDSLDQFQSIPWPVDIRQHKIWLALKNKLAGCFGRLAFSDDTKLAVCKGVFDATPKKRKVVKNCQTNPIRQWDLRANTGSQKRNY